VEAAADAVLNGTASGVLSFSRATGEIIELEVERLSAHSFDVGMSGGSRRNSGLVVLVAGLQFTPVSFAALIEFLGRNIYSASPTLEYAVTDAMTDVGFLAELNVCHVDAGLLFCLQFQGCFFRAMLFRGLSGTLPEDVALRMNLKSLMTPCKCTWTVIIGGLMLDEEGKVFWADESGSEDTSDSFDDALFWAIVSKFGINN
jgi:hypothetical protein